MSNENVQAGVDYGLMKNFKKAMVAMGKQTMQFALRWDVEVKGSGLFRYVGPQKTHWFKPVIEGLGNKDWLAAWMEKYAGDGKHYRSEIPVDSMMMAVNDALAFGARPFNYQDEITAPNSDFFGHAGRNAEIVGGYFNCCQENGIALTQGESAPYVYLLHTTLPTFDEQGKKVPTSAPFDAASYTGSVQGVIAPESNFVDGSKLCEDCVILGTPADEWCSNGASIHIKRVWTLPDKYLTKLPNGKTFGEQALIPTKSCVPLVVALQDAGVEICAMGPITGGGVAKMSAVSEHDFTYQINEWPFQMPLTCQFVEDRFGISKLDIWTSFNCGLQYVIIVYGRHVTLAQDAARSVGFDLPEIGVVKVGPRQVVVGPQKNLVLPPQGD